MTYVYKGVGVGTFLHGHDLRRTGIKPAKPTAGFNLSAAMLHVSRGVSVSPCISVTRSYAVAEDYARNAAHTPPTRTLPSYVYVIDVPDPPPMGLSVYDPIEYVASHNKNPLMSPSYHHDGGAKLLLALVDPVAHAALLTSTPSRAPGLAGTAPSGPRVTQELETMANALRDAEVLVVGTIPKAWVAHRFDIY